MSRFPKVQKCGRALVLGAAVGWIATFGVAEAAVDAATLATAPAASALAQALMLSAPNDKNLELQVAWHGSHESHSSHSSHSSHYSHTSSR